MVDRYAAMSDALNKTGRPILFSIVGWGVGDPWTGWGTEVSISSKCVFREVHFHVAE